MTHCPRVARPPGKGFSLSVSLWVAHLLSISRAFPPLSVQGDTLGFFLKQINKCQEVRPEAGWSPQALWGSQVSVARWGPFAFLWPHFHLSFWGPGGRELGREQFEEEAPPNPAAVSLPSPSSNAFQMVQRVKTTTTIF